jgi:hypothetical protein
MAAGKLSFTQTEFRVREDGTYIGAKVSVERTVGTTGLVSVKVTNSSASSLGRGTRKLDFVADNPTTSTGSAQLLTWADGEDGIKTLEFQIIQENLVEGDEYVPLSLGSFKGGAVAGEIPKCNLIIVDDDSAKGEKGDQGIQGLPGAMPVFGEWVNIPLTTGISISGGDLKVRRAGSFIHIQGGVQITISGVNSAVVGANIGTIPAGFNVTPYKEFPISVNAAAGNTLAVGICRYGINNSITVLPSPTYLNQNCYYSIDQVLID